MLYNEEVVVDSLHVHRLIEAIEDSLLYTYILKFLHEGWFVGWVNLKNGKIQAEQKWW